MYYSNCHHQTPEEANWAQVRHGSRSLIDGIAEMQQEDLERADAIHVVQ